MKYVIKNQPTQSELYRIYEIMFYLATELIVKTTKQPINQVLYALATITDTSSNYLILAYSKLHRLPPSKAEIALALAYLEVPVRLIKKKFMHSRTYYGYVYAHFNGESKIELIPMLEREILIQVIKFTTTIKDYSDIFVLTNRRVTYDE